MMYVMAAFQMMRLSFLGSGDPLGSGGCNGGHLTTLHRNLSKDMCVENVMIFGQAGSGGTWSTPRGVGGPNGVGRVCGVLVLPC